MNAPAKFPGIASRAGTDDPATRRADRLFAAAIVNVFCVVAQVFLAWAAISGGADWLLGDPGGFVLIAPMIILAVSFLVLAVAETRGTNARP